MQDIEDLFRGENIDDQKRVVRTKVQRTKKQPKPAQEEAELVTETINTEEKIDDALPGKAKVFVKTYGCSHNISDSEYMAGLLSDYGYTLVDDVDSADACLLNSYTVKNPSQEKFINLVTSAQNKGKKVVVSGCVPQGDRNLKGLETVSILGVT